ncbi:hypothetical protein CANINC_004886 [Pichia inconspicua]|uniref:SH3 domain-containing protein n=1 Tax=Pichia inconspicua TaxID=52247 RepID=A0A4T0WW04_9ASCO|nr:hypothetical protein CANINC_004886 [[Candida] inconspicua]
MMSVKTRATYSWSGDKKNHQLGFMENDCIEILKVLDSDLFYGESVRTKERGLFPANYVDCDLIKAELERLKPTSSRETITEMKKQTFAHSDFNDTELNKFSTSYVQQVLNSSTQSTDTHVSSLFGHSDLSATSAGSYIRHKEDFETKLQSLKTSSSTYTPKTKNALNDIIEQQEKKSKSKFLPSFLRSKSLEEPSFDEKLYLSSVEKLSQLSFTEKSFSEASRSSSASTLKSNMTLDSTSDLERTKSVGGEERAARAKRVLREQPDLILKPQTFITDVNCEKRKNTKKSKRYSLFSIDYTYIDEQISRTKREIYDSPEHFAVNIIAPKYKTHLEKVRAIYMYLTGTFTLKPQESETISTKRMFESHRLPEIMQTFCCTPHQLTWIFFIMAQAVGIECEIILGYLKYPFTLNEAVTDTKKKLILNHSWISVCIEDEYRFIDVILGNPTNDIALQNRGIWDIHIVRDFYFLTRPFDILKTHTPHHIDQQQIVPPIDVVAQLSLPPMYPHGTINGVELYKFNSAVFHLKHYEIYDFELKIPFDYDVQAEVIPYNKEYSNCSSLVQIYHRKGKRIAHFQGIMPKNCPAGFICVTGKKEYSKHWNLLMSIPCFHKGKWKELTWVNTVHGINGIDIYIKEPKIRHLKLGQHHFDIRMHVSEELESELNVNRNGGSKIAFFSPSRKLCGAHYYNGKLQGTFELDQPGSWVIGVLDLKKKRWKFVAEWIVS